MNLLKEWLSGYQKIFVFSGREGRRAYCIFVAFHLIAAIALIIVLAPILGALPEVLSFLVTILWAIAFFFPLLAIMVRRGHDANINGWMTIILAILMFAITLGMLMAVRPVPGSEQANKYGPGTSKAEVFD